MAVAIIGAGASGILTAHALRRRCPGLDIVLIDDRPPGGVAYRDPEPWHLLNSRAAVMSADPDDPPAFATWAATAGPDDPPAVAARPGTAGPGDPPAFAAWAATGPDDLPAAARPGTAGPGGPAVRDAGDYLPRRRFGDYLRRVLADTGADLRVGRAVRITRADDGLTVHLASGLPVRAGHVVLALGPPRPATPAFAAGHPELVPDPWAPGALDAIDPDRPVVVAGTGLTAVDTALTLLRRPRTAPITLVSRHGLLPLTHLPAGAAVPSWSGPAGGTVAPAGFGPAGGAVAPAGFGPAGGAVTPAGFGPVGGAAVPWWPGPVGGAVAPAGTGPAGEPEGLVELLGRQRSLRALVRGVREIAARHPGGWRPVVEAVRPHLDALWAGAGDADRERFLEHCARWWDVHRHRMAAPVAAEIARHRESGALRVRALGVPPHDLDLERAQVINAAGPGRLPGAADPLTAALLADGLVRVGPFGLGLDVGADGRAAGGPLWVVGPLRRGRCWETTAIPEIRAQASALAGSLLRDQALLPRGAAATLVA